MAYWSLFDAGGVGVGGILQDRLCFFEEVHIDLLPDMVRACKEMVATTLSRINQNHIPSALHQNFYIAWILKKGKIASTGVCSLPYP